MKILVPAYAPYTLATYRKALEKAVNLAKSTGGEIHQLYVFDPAFRVSSPLSVLRARFVTQDVTETNYKRVADQFFAEGSQLCGGIKASIKTKVVEGAPESEILGYATQNKIDVIMIPPDRVSQILISRVPSNIAVYQIKGEEVVTKANIVNREKDEIVRMVEVGLLDATYDITGDMRFIPIIAAEEVHFEEGELKPIKIEPFEVAANTYLLPSLYGYHGMGHVLSVGGKAIKKVEEERIIDYSMFAAAVKGEVNKGDLLGTATLLPLKRR